MKKLLLLPLLLIGITTPVKAEALTWNEFWEPFVESYHYGHDHGGDHWQDWRYDHFHPHRPRRRRCEVTVTKKQWIPGHYLGNSYNWIPGYWERRDSLEWRRCGGPDRRRPDRTPL